MGEGGRGLDAKDCGLELETMATDKPEVETEAWGWLWSCIGDAG